MRWPRCRSTASSQARRLSALESVRAKKLQLANAMRADMKAAVGKDLLEKISSQDVPKATEEEVREEERA